MDTNTLSPRVAAAMLSSTSADYQASGPHRALLILPGL
jgi:hypothetical protein